MSTWNYVIGSSTYYYLTFKQKKENAITLATILRGKGWTDIAIAGLFGNIEHEGIFNPGQCEVDHGVPSGNNDTSYNYGLGFIQWTKPNGGNINPLLRYAGDNNKNWWDGDLQADYLDKADDYTYTYGLWGWIDSTEYPITFAQFKQLNTTPSYASSAWLYNVERPGNPQGSEQIRAERAEQWYEIITYTPRFDYLGTDTLQYYRQYNPYFAYDAHGDWIGMNNCTAYAYGRWNELAQATAYNTNYPTGDGYQWYQQGIAKGFAYGTVPKLGSAPSWTYPETPTEGGHVAVVEDIEYDVYWNPTLITCSNSAYNHGQSAPDRPDPRGPNQVGYNYFPWFYLTQFVPTNMSYDVLNGVTIGSFNGFIYHPDITPNPPPTPPIPPTPTPTRTKMPFIFYLKRRI